VVCMVVLKEGFDDFPEVSAQKGFTTGQSHRSERRDGECHLFDIANGKLGARTLDAPPEHTVVASHVAPLSHEKDQILETRCRVLDTRPARRRPVAKEKTSHHI
jgi:hypothetical protein